MPTANAIAEFTGFTRASIVNRAKRWGLGKDIDPKAVLSLKPLDDNHARNITLEQARTELAVEETNLKRMQREKLEGVLADVSDLMEADERFWAEFGAILRRASMPDAERQALADAIRDHSRAWRDSLGK